MKTRNSILLVTLILVVALSMIGCARKMSDTEYEQISTDFTEEFVQTILSYEPTEAELDLEDLAYTKLDEVAQKAGYSADLYLKKAEQLGEDWDDIFDRIDARMNEEYQKFMEQMEQEEAESLLE